MTEAVHSTPPSPTKRTVPVGVPAPGAVGVTVAVKVTFWPTRTDAGARPMDVLVAARAIETATALEDEALSLLSPLYSAVTESLPVAS